MKDIRQVRKVGEGSKVITLPQEWANYGDYLKFEIINENELKLIKVDIAERNNSSEEKEVLKDVV